MVGREARGLVAAVTSPATFSTEGRRGAAPRPPGSWNTYSEMFPLLAHCALWGGQGTSKGVKPRGKTLRRWPGEGVMRRQG